MARGSLVFNATSGKLLTVMGMFQPPSLRACIGIGQIGTFGETPSVIVYGKRVVVLKTVLTFFNYSSVSAIFITPPTPYVRLLMTKAEFSVGCSAEFFAPDRSASNFNTTCFKMKKPGVYCAYG